MGLKTISQTIVKSVFAKMIDGCSYDQAINQTLATIREEQGKIIDSYIREYKEVS